MHDQDPHGKTESIDIDALTISLHRAKAIVELLNCYHEDDGSHAFTLNGHTLAYVHGAVESLLDQSIIIMHGKHPTIEGVDMVDVKGGDHG